MRLPSCLRPGMKSDQYSLAILYQEMLTGVRPFPGMTPAQLAAQHMHGKPNLRPLPQSDQPIVARALAKDPELRYKSCRDMAEELSNKKRKVRKAIRRTATKPGNRAELPFQAAELKPLDPPHCDGANSKLRPTMIVGIGATANKVVAKLKHKLTLRHGELQNAPAISFLCIDTDREELGKHQMNRDQGSLLSDEILGIPLRKAESYRTKSKSHLAWLSRRWIYNIPRTMQTEGVRPLGRLAFADHFETVCERVQDRIKQISSEESLAKTADHFDLDPGENKPRVFIVTSISGGVGSGMALDLAYTIKLLLHENGLPSDEVTGILLHSNYQRTRDPGLSAANAFAFLTEMRHFVENGFPGDDSIGLPEFEDEAPFDFAYFNYLGNDLSQSDYDGKIGKIAEYIALSSVSKCSDFFDKCRDLDAEIGHLALRTFGLTSSNQTTDYELIDKVGRGLVRKWLQADPNVDLDFEPLIDESFNSLRLNQQDAIGLIENASAQALGCFDDIVAGAHNIIGTSPEKFADLQAYLDGVLGRPSSRKTDEDVAPESCLQMKDLAIGLASGTGEQLSATILSVLEAKELRLNDAQEVARGFARRIEMLHQGTERVLAKCENELVTQLSAIQDLEEESELPNQVDRYCRQRLAEFAMRHTIDYYQGVSKSIAPTLEQLMSFESQIAIVVNEFESPEDLPELVEDDSCIEALLNQSVLDDMESHIAKSELQIFESFVKERGGYLKMLQDPSMWNQGLSKEVRNSIQKVLNDAYKKISLESVVIKNNVSPEKLVKWLNAKVIDARPQVDSCGGNSRLMIGLPALSTDSILPAMLEKQFHLKGSPISGTAGSFVLCFEAEDVSFANVAFRILETRPDAIELVKRIQTRNDVDWTTLDDLL